MGVAFSPDGKTLATGYSGDRFNHKNGMVLLWDVASRRRLTGQPLEVEEGQLMGVAFSPDGKALAAAYGGNRDSIGGVVLWDAASRQRLTDQPLAVSDQSLLVKQAWVVSVTFSPDGKYLAATYHSGEWDIGGVVLWDASSRRRLTGQPLAVREGVVTSVAFSPDGKTLATGYSGQEDISGVVLWDAASHRRLTDQPIGVKEGKVAGVTFRPDGKALVVAYVGGPTAKFRQVPNGIETFDMDPTSWIHRAGRIANRNLTWAEWRQAFLDEPYRKTFENLPLPADLPPDQVRKAGASR